ncbi:MULTISPECIES: MerR family transcriptional regulator [unclassified Ensifer]|uniref:MerR family transcriptional regulator n=1 Tax=unclassified Ensifer TaxID=2633371 RepID=UPI00081330AE|nr:MULTISPECIES: MerR family transcriptional regulator [unclassified Ensifer]OCP01735.1 LuxR family transcriptional regulator [Ensifer sp. LC14]OCP09524.1 LuxR family transcriptional regulator [Ensifer sp. LC13]OCP10840.1 LuxR family transcriptional regulator [Ensifer sp. LC11]OCP32772.1 LuxR family transcriptional regulator [Ensifer sp. LC499]
MPRDHWKYEGVLAAPDRVGFLPNLPLPHHDPMTPLAIADMADAFGVTHRTLHFYEEKGLLTAARMGPMRVYGEEHIRRMAVINACREIDMPIAAILELLTALATTADQPEADRLFREALLARRRELAAQQANLRRQMQRITELLETGDAGGGETDEDGHIHLSPIESECLTFMADGYPAPRIAGLMDMDVAAALTLEAGIIRKFGANNRFQAIAKAVLAGMIAAE